MPMQNKLTAGLDMEALSETPMTKAELDAAPRRPRVFILRRAFGLTQEEFAARFAIPLGTLRDWEQRRSAPDATAQAYLKVIAADPESVAKAVGNTAA
jgi:putative transcriptional regulator